jgi:hypothetical protein
MGVPQPDTEDVERILGRVMKGLAKDFAEVGEGWAEDGLEALWLEGVQHRLPLWEEPKREQRRGRRVAVMEGFSLHADTRVHRHDRSVVFLTAWRSFRSGVASRGPRRSGSIVRMLRTALLIGSITLSFGGLAILQSGCLICTEAGCLSGTQLNVLDPNGAPVSDFSGTATWGGQTVSFTYPFPQGEGTSCRDGRVHIDSEDPPRSMEVSITASGGRTFNGTVNLSEPKRSRPNGPGCDPVCLNNSGELTLVAP